MWTSWSSRLLATFRSQHNYLRITRILKSLGELGYEGFKAPLVRLFLEESLYHSTLPNMQHSILEYFVYTIRLPATRRRLLRYARQHYRPAHAFLWGPLPKRQRGVAGGGAGSSGIRAPAPTPEQQRRGEESITSTGSGIIMSSHDSMTCHELGRGVFSGLEGAQMVVRVRGARSDYGEIDTL